MIKAPGLSHYLPAFTYAPRSAAFIDFLTRSQALPAPKSCGKTCRWPLSKFFLPGDVSAVKGRLARQKKYFN